ncbi:MAG: hypothetical protein BWY84_01078 [Candidatus Aerophobetes bacterium ADurb.Bin490]|nr:MAG: hypothetical protein BWY84_01078 [Candidatus Aerophobetes bacterium ADurb.Bin490]
MPVKFSEIAMAPRRMYLFRYMDMALSSLFFIAKGRYSLALAFGSVFSSLVSLKITTFIPCVFSRRQACHER